MNKKGETMKAESIFQCEKCCEKFILKVEFISGVCTTWSCPECNEKYKFERIVVQHSERVVK